MQIDKIGYFLSGIKFRLNGIFFLSYILNYSAITGLASGLILLFLRWTGAAGSTGTGSTGSGPAVWIFCCVLGAFAGIVRAYPKRINLDSSALWADRELRSHDIFTAYLSVKNRNFTGLFDPAVSEQANTFFDSMQTHNLKWPFQGILRQAGNTALILLVTGFFIFFWKPSEKINLFAAEAKQTVVSFTDLDKKEKGNIKPVEDLRTLVKKLFPKNDQLAVEALKNLMNNNMEEVRDMVEKNRSEMEKMLDRDLSPSERQEIEKQMQDQQQAMNEMNQEQQEGQKMAEQPPQNQQEQQEQQNQNPQNRQGNQQQAGENKPAEGNNSQPGDKKPENSRTERENNQDMAGQQGGTGKGNSTKNDLLGKLSSGKSAGDLFIGKRKGGASIQYVVPGKNSSMPVTEILPDLKKAAETAMNKENIPTEYEGYVRDYFYELMKEMEE